MTELENLLELEPHPVKAALRSCCHGSGKDTTSDERILFGKSVARSFLERCDE